jgi:BRCA1-associated protein
LEYSYLLTSQLESQRFFFEKQIEDLTLQLSHLEPRPKATDKQKIKHLEKELSEERMINSQLIKNQQEFQRQLDDLSARLKKKDEKIADLEEQLRDIMFYLESQEKVRQNPELELGSVSVKIKR